MFQEIKNFFAKNNREQWLIFALFVFTIFLQCSLFHWFCFHSVLISSLWKYPFAFFQFWGSKFIPALFLASFIFITKKTWWTIVVHIICDIWLVANLFYYKANSLFLSFETMKMADNMSGFWNSLSAYMGWDIISFFLVTIVYVIALYACPKKTYKKNVIKFISVILLTILLSVFNKLCYAKVMHDKNNENEATAQLHSHLLSIENFHYYPFGSVYYYAKIETWKDYNEWAHIYVKDNSILNYFPASFIFEILRPTGEIVTLSEQDVLEVEPFFNINDTIKLIPTSNLIFILFESLESWPIDTVCGYNYMPNITKLIHNKHVLYCEKLKSQVKHGNSADGQMIAVTGLLPISNGATCRLYADNIFPSFAEYYPHSSLINPTPGIWAQEKMAVGYQFSNLIEPQDKGWDDEDVINEVLQYVDTVKTPFAVLGITVTSHVPFTHGAEYVKFNVEGMPPIMSAYLNCLNYTDSCVGVLINKILSNETLKDNTTIVISGDHTIFRSQNVNMDNFATKNSINMKSTKTFTPLIIYSPFIEENIQLIDKEYYQMDIFPTIMHLIGCENYYWKGFGVNLLDSVVRNNRLITEQEAYILSDKLIRANHFHLIKNN